VQLPSLTGSTRAPSLTGSITPGAPEEAAARLADYLDPHKCRARARELARGGGRFRAFIAGHAEQRAARTQEVAMRAHSCPPGAMASQPGGGDEDEGDEGEGGSSQDTGGSARGCARPPSRAAPRPAPG